MVWRIFNFTPPILQGLIALDVALIVVWLGWYKSILDRYNAACSIFAETFTPFLRDLTGRSRNVDLVIKENFSNQEVAWRNFMPYLSPRRRNRCEALWLKYENEYKQINKLERMLTIELPAAQGEEHRKKFQEYEVLCDRFKPQNERKKELYNTIGELLRITKRKL